MFCVMIVMSVWASDGKNVGGDGTDRRVFDMAGLFSEDEISGFETVIAEYRKDMKMDLVVVTTEDAGGKSAQGYADDFFDEGGFGYGRGRSGVLFLIDMDHRELTLSTSGDTIRLLTDERIEGILDDVYEGASEGDFADSVEKFLADVAYYHEKGIVSGQYNYDTETGRISVHRSIRWYEALVALVVSGIVAGTVCMGVVNRYAMKREHSQASGYLMAYRAGCKLQNGKEKDNLINKFVTTRVIPRNNSGRNGGGGRSSSGRSSTHRSSSGRSHGGGGRKF